VAAELAVRRNHGLVRRMANNAWLEKPGEPVTGGRRALNGEQTIANFVTPNV
jgi:hypothetical protein